MRKTGIMLAVALLILNTAGCSLLPKEEEIRTVEDTTQDVEYETAVVVRTSMDIYASIPCQYEAEEEQGLSFDIDGLAFGKTYVSVGDKVEKGQVLAELDLGTLSSDKKHSLANLEKLQLQESYLEDMIYYEQLKGQVSKNAYTESKENVTGLYSELLEVRQQETIANVQIAEVDKEIKKRQIIAPQGGTITKVEEKLKGGAAAGDQLSQKGTDVIKMTDKSFCYVATTDLYENFSKGDTVNMSVSGVNIKMKIREILAEEQKMYLDFAGDISGLSSFSSGRIDELMDYRSSALCVPAEAVVKLDGKDYVYVVGKDGMREVREVELGVSNGTNVEVLGGVDEGTLVILK